MLTVRSDCHQDIRDVVILDLPKRQGLDVTRIHSPEGSETTLKIDRMHIRKPTVGMNKPNIWQTTVLVSPCPDADRESDSKLGELREEQAFVWFQGRCQTTASRSGSCQREGKA